MKLDFLTENSEIFVILPPPPPLSANALAEKVGQACRIDSTKILCKYSLCSKHFVENYFSGSEMVCLNRLAVPHGLDSASHSTPKPTEPFSNSLPSFLSREHSFRVQPPTRTYSKAFVSSFTETPLHIHEDSPFIPVKYLHFRHHHH
jgi:hypothetical protein